MQTNNPWPCGGCSSEWGFSEGSQPFGIFRLVLLIETDEVRVEPFGVHVWNNEACDSVFVDTEVKNYSDHEQTIEVISKLALSSGKTAFRQTGKITLKAGETQVVRHQAKISDAHLWSITGILISIPFPASSSERARPSMMLATPFSSASALSPGRYSDRNRLRSVAIQPRWIRKTADSISTAAPVFINGTCDYEHLLRSECMPASSRADSLPCQDERQAGFNAFREAHQPHNLSLPAVIG